jgi:hypothetical protein
MPAQAGIHGLPLSQQETVVDTSFDQPSLMASANHSG